jgi:hypothetical protein
MQLTKGVSRKAVIPVIAVATRHNPSQKGAGERFWSQSVPGLTACDGFDGCDGFLSPPPLRLHNSGGWRWPHWKNSRRSTDARRTAGPAVWRRAQLCLGRPRARLKTVLAILWCWHFRQRHAWPSHTGSGAVWLTAGCGRRSIATRSCSCAWRQWGGSAPGMRGVDGEPVRCISTGLACRP